MTYVGVDWAGRGWLAVAWDGDDSWRGAVYPSTLNLWRDHRETAEQILVDIPIGLPESDVRECDRAARDLLGSTRGRSVFYTPCRDAVYEQCITTARETNEAALDRSISNQTWSITPSIREVDAFLREFPAAVGPVRESHPEVAFAGLRDRGAIDESKLTESGHETRLEALDDAEPGARDAYHDLARELVHDPPRYAPILGSDSKDDLVDAIALAVTAERGCESRFEVLGGGEDAEGLPMEIAYAETG